MKINNNFLYNFLYTSSSRYPSALPSFAGRKEDDSVMRVKLSDSQVSKIKQLADTYEETNTNLSKFNGIYQKKIKASFDDMTTIDKVKGFLFKPFDSKTSGLLQVVKTNPKRTSSELLTFNLIDEENKQLMQFKIGKDGFAEVKADKSIPDKKLKATMQEENIKYVDRIIASLKRVGFYALNYSTLSKQARRAGQEDMSAAIEQYNDVQNSVGLQQEIQEIKEKTEILHDLLYKRKSRDSYELRRSFFGDIITPKTKGLIFENAISENKTIVFYPFQDKSDERAFRLTILDNKGNKEGSFVFFNDGRISKQKDGLAFDKDFRQNKMYFVSDKDVEKYKLGDVLLVTQNKLEGFIDYIKESRQNKRHRNVLSSAEKEAQAIAKQKQREMKKEALELKKLELQRKKELLQQVKEQRRLEKEKLKEQKAAQRLRVIEEQRLSKKSKQNEPKKKIVSSEKRNRNTIEKTSKQIIEKRPEIIQNQSLQNITRSSSLVDNTAAYNSIVISQVSEQLGKIFDTPVEERSPHLIHEVLSKGTIFGGRFSVVSSDGSKITVSRIKSPRYVEFVYYSVRVKTKQGEEFVMNIDPVVGRILENTSEGKPLIDRKMKVHHISKERFLKENPSAINLPLYFSEIFSTRKDVERKTIKFKKEQTSQSQLLAQKERDLIKALQQTVDVEDFNE